MNTTIGRKISSFKEGGLLDKAVVRPLMAKKAPERLFKTSKLDYPDKNGISLKTGDYFIIDCPNGAVRVTEGVARVIGFGKQKSFPSEKPAPCLLLRILWVGKLGFGGEELKVKLPVFSSHRSWVAAVSSYVTKLEVKAGENPVELAKLFFSYQELDR